MEKIRKKNKELSDAARIRFCGTSSSNGRERGSIDENRLRTIIREIIKKYIN